MFNIFKDPKKDIGQKIGESGALILGFFVSDIVPYFQYASGTIIEGLGSFFESDSMRSYGLKMKEKGVLSGGQDSFLAKEALPGLINDIIQYNDSTDDIEDKIDLGKLTDLKTKIEDANKGVKKNEPNTMIPTPSFMNYGQNSSNVNIPFKKESQFGVTLFDPTRPVVFANGQLLQGRKDDAILFFDEKANQIASVKKPVVKLNLTGTIDLTKHDLDNNGVKDATNIVSKQIINQMVYNS